MGFLKRSQFILITFEHLDVIEANKAEGGADSPLPDDSWIVTSLITGEHILSDADELNRLRSISSYSWSESTRLSSGLFTEERLAQFADLGILLSDSQCSNHRRIRQTEETLIDSGWPPGAATYHFLNQHQESGLSRSAPRRNTPADLGLVEHRAAQFIGKYGLPPPAFYRHPCSKNVNLLPEASITSIGDTLGKRRTCRSFAVGQKLDLTDLATLLRLVFGTLATRELANGAFTLQLKSSPSGGSLHPIEAFPLILKCEGQGSGLYHYRVDEHVLALIRELPEKAAREWAIHLAREQSFVGTCAVVVVLVARFDRNFWKYRERENSYAVVLQDAGHLSQAFQLVATELGLGSFYTAAINSDSVADSLGLRYPAEAPIGLLGVGIRSQGPSPEDLAMMPFELPGRRE